MSDSVQTVYMKRFNEELKKRKSRLSEATEDKSLRNTDDADTGDIGAIKDSTIDALRLGDAFLAAGFFGKGD